MSDDNSQSSQGSSGKTWLGRITQMLQGEPQNKEELVEVIADAQERSLIDPETKDMMEGVLGVSELKVRDIMIPRSQMITLDVDQSLEQQLPTMVESSHSRFPVICEDKDHVEGILLAKDLLPLILNKDENLPAIREYLRPAIVVPESKRVDTLLNEFRQKRYHMAIVVDEYGGVSGLVTIEDILEIIVGEIEDEHDDDEEQQDIRQLSKHVYMVQALTPLDEFNEFFKTGYDTQEADTIGGIILHAFGHMPSRGETIDIEPLQFKVTNSDNRRIIQLQVTVPKTEDGDDEAE
ncbi:MULTISPECIES: CNNM family magnesium/cobalt transport protein CorC [Pseudoalteromonas]|uniref:Magnesium and cobalt efflux protein CorC n=1 Tax=Pseudoalteromonas amylolytica TaxID=1859457 RepID=A0A1S1ML03_9GAMM|nr:MULTISPECIES: CNNM family magnesium/cobalt transport protein CorC [Pseudoalteromonas]MCF6437065.1 CNNM family magnesium/cobalt transport protein CorC [Pseudoalteromonas sp. MMG022]OHU85738.1 magnesium/cobalt efflux protein [Pseudoalteromonas sp. JW3]OHU87360.1 magnesium/cobalt efflux protein [Pseudoalteromonas amylolytica]